MTGCFPPAFLLALAMASPAFGHEGHGGDVTAAEKAAFERARPVFEKHCYRCHSTRGGNGNKKALPHLDMDTYPFAGHHAGELGAKIREVLGATGKEPTMPDDEPGAVKGDELKRVLAWADEFDKAHPAQEHEEHEHGVAGDLGHRGGDHQDHEAVHDHEGAAEPGMEHVAVSVTPAQLPYATPRETMVPGRPGMPGGYHLKVNAYGHLQNVGLGNYTISNAGESFGGGRTIPLLTDDWAMGYWRDAAGWAEAMLMLDFEPLTVGKGGYPELGQSGEGLFDAQHSHQLLHQAMVAIHPLAGTSAGAVTMEHEPAFDLSLFGGQGSATLGPAIFMHRASSAGPTVPRKHHKGENPHETFPVMGAAFRWQGLWLEASVFSARELTPDDSRFYPHAAAPKSFAARVRYDLGDWLEAQVSGERLRAQGQGEPDAWQGSASLYAYRSLGGWRIDGLLDLAIDDPDDEPSAKAALLEVALRDATYRNVFWARTEVNQREDSGTFGDGVSTWTFQSLGAEHVFAASAESGLQLGFFGEATYVRIPSSLEAIYGHEDAVTLNVGLHLFGMWMFDGAFRRMAHHPSH